MDTVYGKHAARAVLLARPRSVQRMILGGKPEYHEDLVKLARGSGIEPELLAWPEFRRLSGLTDDDKHQGICLFTADRQVLSEADLDRLRDARVVLALDQINDPQNLGTMLRTAAFFGVDAVLVLKNRSAEVTPLVARIAVGGAELVDVFRVTNLARALGSLKEMGFWVYGLDERGPATLAETAFDLEVTETEPGLRGDTASGGGTKPETVETGATVQVPLFVDVGERIRVDTRTGKYMSRA